MPTYAQLQREPWWGAEYQPPTLAKLCADLRALFRVGAIEIGSKGDNNHLRGYHRSRAWVLNSAFCTNRTYSVTETAGNRAGGDPNWLCAIDMTIPTAQLLPMCQRLDAAVRSGRLEKVTEWYGNTDGDQRVDGYNNIANRVATSDSSHLWHLHISLDRGRAGEDHADLYAVLTGIQGDDMPRLARVRQTGGIYITTGVEYRHIVDAADLKTQQQVWGLSTWTDIDASQLPHLGEDISAAEGGLVITDEQLAEIAAAAERGAEKGSPTHEELVAAANEAEDS